jgi:hypothetical protein
MLRITNAPLESIQTPEDFLKAIGREAETKLSVESWTKFWKMDGRSMREAGIGTKDRRYVIEIMVFFPLGKTLRSELS